MKNAMEDLREKATEILETEDGIQFVLGDGEKITFPLGSQFLKQQSEKKRE